MQPTRKQPLAPDALTRLLPRLEPEPNNLWEKAQPSVDNSSGIPVLDDST